MTLNFSHAARTDIKNEALKRRLVDCVHAEKDKFITVAENFYRITRRSEQNYLELCDAIIAAVDQVMKEGPWEDSLFLRNTIKPLQSIREQALELQANLKKESSGHTAVGPAIKEECVKLYVSLYQANGHDMKQWAGQLSSLSSYMVGRPVYQDEDSMIKTLRLKQSQTSEAYVVVAVDKSKIISRDFSRPRKDRLGNLLVNLIPGSVDSENIIEFVHQDKHYYFYNNQLVPAKN